MEFTNASRQAFTAEMSLAGPPERVFPLLCPVREYDWIESWSCVMVFSESGVAELGCIFVTSDHHDPGDEVWTVSRYEPNRAIEFVRVLPGRWVTKLDIALTPRQDGTTSARWTITQTALTEAGAAGMDAARERMVAVPPRLELELNHYLTTGEMLRTAR